MERSKIEKRQKERREFMNYVSVKVTGSKKKFIKLLHDVSSENGLPIVKDTILEVKKQGKNNITLLSIDEEVVILNNKLIDKFIEFI
jgi:hypothetical protein